MSKLTVEELEDIQGIILSGYGHLSYASFLFLYIRDAVAAKKWIRIVTRETTTSKPWRVLPNGEKEKPLTTVNVAFTYAGFKALSLPKQTLNSFAEEFIEGMVSRSEVLGDRGASAAENWELGGPNNEEIHVLLMLYGVDEKTVEELLDHQLRHVDDTRGGVIEVSIQDAHRPDSKKEAFGFHDGLSQPDIQGIQRHKLGDPAPDTATGEFILGYLNEYDMYPVSPVVPAIHDREGLLPLFPDGVLPDCRDFGCHGTYLVYRKVEQWVAMFWQFIQKECDGTPRKMNELASKFFGRWPSGAPLTLVPQADDPNLADENTFSFMPQDKDGYRCPIGAHIRRANPRDSLVNDTPTESYKTSARHRIIRRGMSYGEPAFPPEAVENGNAPVDLKDDGESRGLHFFAINASIARQFEFLTQTWLNDPTFAVQFNDKDPIVGDNNDTYFMTIQGESIRRRIPRLPRFIEVKGGAYFFMPSMTALRYLSGSNDNHNQDRE